MGLGLAIGLIIAAFLGGALLMALVLGLAKAASDEGARPIRAHVPDDDWPAEPLDDGCPF